MRTIHKRVRLLSLFCIAALCIACAGQTSPTPGAAAPSLALPTLEGDRVRLADFQGKVVLVNFWASWCEPCVREMPRLQQWHEQYSDDGLVVLGVNTLYQDSQPEVEAFVQKLGVTYPMLLDAEGEQSRRWLAQPLPRSYIIDRQGVVRWTRLGEVTEDNFEAHIAPLLREAP